MSFTREVFCGFFRPPRSAAGEFFGLDEGLEVFQVVVGIRFGLWGEENGGERWLLVGLGECQRPGGAVLDDEVEG